MNKTETEVNETNVASTDVQAKKKHNVKELILQFWPFLLAIAGRGGVLGIIIAGCAVVANQRILQSQLPQSQKVIYCIVSGVVAIAVYFVAVLMIVRFMS